MSVPKERVPHERRVALVPDSVARLVKGGAAVVVERGAGTAALASDDAYAAAGAALADDAAGACADADVVVKVQRPLPDEVALLPEGATLVCLLGQGGPDADAVVRALAGRRVTTLALERVPRITRAQSMDVLSSQSTVAGYKAALLGAAALGRLLPMLTTAAGSLAPARAFVLGAGVAGLQAIATARRLGAVVSAFDVRLAAAEQVKSLGATFVAAETLATDAETKGGYARAQTDEERARTMAAVGAHLATVDLAITTALVPGRPAPRLITAEMVAAMKPGAVIVDLAAESGGNCALTRAGETVVTPNGVTVLGPVNLPSTVPVHASQMFSKNVLTLLEHLTKDGTLDVDPSDEIAGAMIVKA
ncbi:MAG: NAD(P) transhydrogenase subunit alpha [Gemmatimonadaceae bacterium]